MSKCTPDSLSFVSDQILTRPTGKSVTVIIVPKKALEIFYQYGTEKSVYTNQSQTVISEPNVPVKIVLQNLSPDTRYYYRINYRETGASGFIAGEEFTFVTKRGKGRRFKFDLLGDSHLYDKKGNDRMMNVTLGNILKDTADFVLEIGDTFGDDRDPTSITQYQMMKLHLDYMPFIGTVSHSSPFYFCLGNHEGESGYFLLQTPPNNLAVWGTLARKYYFSNPAPDGFYSGNSSPEGNGIGLPENYYSWEWGDALFIVLDAYRYATANSSPGVWDWTLGLDQYNWFKQTLEESTVKYKIVFIHHVMGYGRGGIIMAKKFEWGGYNNNGTTWGFSTYRPGWAMPIHQLMVANNVNILFQGHDHLFAKEVLDGIVYQELPMPSDSSYMIGWLANSDAYTGDKLSGTGHLSVTVSPEFMKIDYISAYLPEDTVTTGQNGEVVFSYTVNSAPSSDRNYNHLPTTFNLEQNYPNPFNPGTTIEYTIPRAGSVTMTVYDILGREAAKPVDEFKEAGSYTVQFSAADLKISGGVYFYMLRSDNLLQVKKMIYQK